MHESRTRACAVALSVSIAVVTLWTRESAGQFVLEETSALLVFPVVAQFQGPSISTAIEVTADSFGTTLRLTYLAADTWNGAETTCALTAQEMASFTAFATSATDLSITGECGGNPVVLDAAGHRGVLVVAQTDGQGGTLIASQIYGSARIVDATNNAGFSVDPVAFKGDSQAPGESDRVYQFDGVEFDRFPSAYGAHFFSDDATSLRGASLILATLDGRAGDLPRAKVEIRFFDDDEVSASVEHSFDGFEIVRLSGLDIGFLESSLGSESGHLIVTPKSISQPELKHDLVHGDGDGDRNSPVLVWVMHEIVAGGVLGGSTLTTGTTHFGARADASLVAVVPNAGDTPTLDLTPIPEPTAALLWMAGLAYLRVLGRRRGFATRLSNRH